MSRVVIVTGAASGNGKAITERFLRNGDRVAAIDINNKALDDCLSGDWSEHSDRVSCIAADVSVEADIQEAVEGILTEFGEVHVVVNNAGITGSDQATDIVSTSVDEFDQIMAVNIRSAYIVSRSVLPGMLEQAQGIIINIASVAGLVAFPGRAAYSMSKGALIQLTKTIAVDFGGQGIRSNALCPGMIETPMTKWRLDQPELRSAVLNKIPQDEIGSATDVAEATYFLASDEAHYFNGAAIPMDGGYLAI